eukprot:c24348_g1_i2 orf=188-451(+)
MNNVSRCTRIVQMKDENRSFCCNGEEMVGEKLKLGMKIETAYHLALNTWATWVKTKIDHNRTQVFFRSFEPAHWEGSWRDRMCPVET